MLQLIYVSAATRPFTTLQLRDLLSGARTNNTRLDVSGFLLHQQGWFLQVLEGEPAAVEGLFERIGFDPRHGRVLTLSRREVTERNFGDWSMGFIDAAAARAPLPGFRASFALTDLAGDGAATKSIVDGFRDGRWRQVLR